MKTGREISSGGIIYEQGKDGLRVALICRGEGKIWGLPKGKLEKGETPEHAAVREVEEETGLKGDIEAKLGDIKYVYYAKWDDTRYFKVVSFYLIRMTGGDISKHDDEVEVVEWFTLADALRRLTYKGEKDMMRKAIAEFKKRGRESEDKCPKI